MVRLNKKMSEIGYCSRRKADELIKSKKITVNGEIAKLGQLVSKDDIIEVNGEVIKRDDEKIILAYNKPKGVICTESKVEKNVKITDLIKKFNIDKRIFTVGRLDKDTEGLIILTNDGDLARDITNTKNDYEKEYEVKVDKNIDDNFIEKMEKGVYLTELNVRTKRCKIKKNGDKSFYITITQGLNRQVRRMCKELGFRVTYLKRVRIINLRIEDLKVGEYRYIEREDIGI